MKKRINVILGCFGFVAILACSGNEATKVKKENSAQQPSAVESGTMLDYKTEGPKGGELFLPSNTNLLMRSLQIGA
ncbi:hypothetical protein [Sphingobacterium multivorum]|uniref:hypothetical protein n=1 Tax=Sphingobacterium multivorum TaxID=28454 RepID=UPI000EBEF9FC|nr:hypothetical protein [Sphingobacterium multivorum]QQT60628.1 hypothetical protein I6I97_15510 [Sphingobacterium multivorum]HAL54364.1 hypothetical protein [Sphingobacterium sp.]